MDDLITTLNVPLIGARQLGGGRQEARGDGRAWWRLRAGCVLRAGWLAQQRQTCCSTTPPAIASSRSRIGQPSRLIGITHTRAHTVAVQVLWRRLNPWAVGRGRCWPCWQAGWRAGATGTCKACSTRAPSASCCGATSECTTACPSFLACLRRFHAATSASLPAAACLLPLPPLLLPPGPLLPHPRTASPPSPSDALLLPAACFVKPRTAALHPPHPTPPPPPPTPFPPPRDALLAQLAKWAPRLGVKVKIDPWIKLVYNMTSPEQADAALPIQSATGGRVGGSAGRRFPAAGLWRTAPRGSVSVRPRASFIPRVPSACWQWHQHRTLEESAGSTLPRRPRSVALLCCSPPPRLPLRSLRRRRGEHCARVADGGVGQRERGAVLGRRPRGAGARPRRDAVQVRGGSS